MSGKVLTVVWQAPFSVRSWTQLSHALALVWISTSSRRAMYSKIIHRQLNTMSVNETWSWTDDKCLVCLHEREDWIHPLVCQSPDIIRVRDRKTWTTSIRIPH